MNWEELFRKKKFAPKGYRTVPLDGYVGYVTTLEYFTCNYKGCYEPAITRTAEGFYCEKHLKEHK
jgi:hypothetical protein